MTRLLRRIALAVMAALALSVAPACNSDTDGQAPAEGRVENNKPEGGGVPEGEETDPDSGGSESSTTTAPTESGGGGGVTGGDEGGAY